MSEIYTRKERLLVILFASLVFTIYSFIVFNINIHGDSKYHALSAEVSAEQESLAQHQPYRIFNYSNNRPVYMPIAYPLTAESLFTIMFLFGGETMLKLYAPLFATGIFFMAYFCIREIGIIQAATTSAFSVFAIGERLIMTPLMEPFFVLALLTACLLLKKYYFSNKSLLLYCASFFLGVAACIKQQGLILSTFIVGFVFCFFIYKLIKEKVSRFVIVRTFFIFLIIFLFVPFFAFKNQIDRTGTLAYAPGGTSINGSLPFSKVIQSVLTSQFPSNPNALAAIRKVIGYNTQKVSLVDKFKGFILSPFLYYRSTDTDYYDTYQTMLVEFIVALAILCLLSKDKIIAENKFILILFFGLFFTETTTSYLFRTPIDQYHSFGMLITTLLIFFFAYRFTIASKYIRLIIVSLLVIFFIMGYVTYLYPTWGQSGREDNTQLEGYKRIAKYVEKNTPPQSVFLAAETSFRYYAQRDVIWLNESIGDRVYETINASNAPIAIKDLKKLKVNYIVINRAQLSRRGVNDYLPPYGLVSFIDHSKYFTKVFDAYDNNQMVVYKVNYLEE